MCLALPMKVVSLDDKRAMVECEGKETHADISLLRNSSLKRGDYIFVHDHLAIHKIPRDEALDIIRITKEMAG